MDELISIDMYVPKYNMANFPIVSYQDRGDLRGDLIEPSYP
jgi:hypothetical protein